MKQLHLQINFWKKNEFLQCIRTIDDMHIERAEPNKFTSIIRAEKQKQSPRGVMSKRCS